MTTIEVKSVPTATFRMNTYPVVHVTMHRTPKNAEEWVGGYLRPLVTELRKRSGPFVLVVDVVPGAELNDSRVRSAYDRFIEENWAEVYSRCRGFAIVIHNPVTRMFLTALSWAVKKPITMKHFASLHDAEVWAYDAVMT